MTRQHYGWVVLVVGMVAVGPVQAQEAIGASDRNIAVNQVNQAVAVSVSATLAKYVAELNASINTLRTCGSSSRFAADNQGNCK